MKSNPAEILKNCIHLLYREGLTTSSGGNISCKDEDEYIWITPSQVDKGFLRAEDIACINKNGKLLNSNKPSMEFPFHLSIYKNYPEVKAVCHLHSPILVALSLLQPNDDFFRILEDFNYAFARYAMPGSEQLGENICNAFEKDPEIVIMQNHGAVAVGKTMTEAWEKVKRVSDQVQSYFKIDDSSYNSINQDSFNLKPENTIDFFMSRALHFLSIDNDFEIEESVAFYSAKFKLKSLKELQKIGILFTCKVIPESYLLLNDFVELNNDEAIVKGTTLYNFYDRMEVLDFTAKVILLANRMGPIGFLNENQIQELRNNFLTS